MEITERNPHFICITFNDTKGKHTDLNEKDMAATQRPNGTVGKAVCAGN